MRDLMSYFLIKGKASSEFESPLDQQRKALRYINGEELRYEDERIETIA